MRSSNSRRSPVAVAVLAGTVLASVVVVPAASAAQPTDLFFSEYIEGGPGNPTKAVEIYNGTSAPIDLAAGSYAIDVMTNGSAVATFTDGLTGTIAPGDVLVVANPGSVSSVLAVADLLIGHVNMNGDDALVLRKGSTVLDVFGEIPGPGGGALWGTPPTSSANHTLRRKPSITAGDTNGSDAFDPAAEWLGYADGTYDGLGSHTIDATGDDDPDPGDAGGTVTADVTLEAAAAPCLQLDHTSISFGTLPFGAVDEPATPELTVTNCSTVAGTVYASGSDATGPSAAWSLVTSGTCAAGLDPNEFRLRLASPDLASPVELGTTNASVGSLPPGASTTHTAHIDTACPGSSGEGVTMTFSIDYLATAD